MSSRIIVKNLPKKISQERFEEHFGKIGQITDAKLKFTKDGKFRQFGFIGFKSDEEAVKAVNFFNNTYIDTSKLVVEICKPLNDPDKGRPWSKYSKKPDVNNNSAKKISAKKPKPEEKDKEDKKSKKEKRLEKLLGDLNEDEQFKEFLAANKAIKSKENIWKNDIDLGLNTEMSNGKKYDDSEKSEGSNSESENSDEEEDEEENKNEHKKKDKPNESNENLKNDEKKEEIKNKEGEDDEDFENGRMFIRNLCYTCKEEDLEKLFAPYAPLVEVNIPIDNFSKKSKGFAYVTCMFPEKAIKAFNELDGTIFQGRMLHIIPAKSKREDVEDENAHKTFKDKKDEELKKKAQSSHNWNSLFINQNSVANLMASRYNVDKSELFDVHSTKNNSIAVKLAVGETQIVNDIRSFLIRNGVKLDAFNNANTERSKTVILVKNLPNNATENDLREAMTKFKVNGGIKRFVMPEYGIAALIEFNERQEARDAFKKMAYRKFKSLPLYLEWAPVDVFDVDPEEKAKAEKEEQEKNASLKKNESDEKNTNTKKTKEEPDDEEFNEPNATLFVKNLNFDTTEETLQKFFSKIAKCKATIARKISPNKELLSMGYGFVKFKTASGAKEAIKTLQNHMLDGHVLELKFSNRTSNENTTTNEKRNNKQAKQPKQKSSKILVRNIPFEAKAKEVEELFRVFGELKYVRLPKKIDGAHRGFGFVDFVSISDAERAFEALCHSTHLFGRRLVLEWAEPEQTQDVEVLRMREEQLSGPSSKRLKKSQILEDLGRDDEFGGERMDDS